MSKQHWTFPSALIDEWRTSALEGYDARTNIFKMLTLVNEWTNFANHTYDEAHPDAGTISDFFASRDIDTTWSVANSLEAIHDTLHFCLGGIGGHMGDIAYAGSWINL